MSDVQKELEVLFPQGKQITVKGETLNVTPFKLGELPKLFKIVEPIFGSIQELTNLGSNKALLFTSLMSKDGESFILLASMGIRKPVEWVNDLDLDEAADVLLTVIEVNLSFFVQKVLPNLNERVEKLTNKSGLTS